MNVKPSALLLALACVGGCVNVGDIDDSFVLPDYDAGYPDALQHDPEVLSLGSPDGYTNQSQGNPDQFLPYVLRRYRLGPPNYREAQEGGLTLIIEGTGEPICVAVDPENTREDSCDYNDGDADLFIGRSQDYSGEFGTSLGTFSSTWTDDLGVLHETDNNLCSFGVSPTEPLGRSVAESCAFETEVGQQYVVVLRTFTVPVDDNILNMAVLLQPGHQGTAQCVFPSSGDRYLVNGSAENLDESDSAFPDNPYADLRDPCFCPANDAERSECGLE